MFTLSLAIIIPPGKKDRRILLSVIISFAAGLAAAYAPVLSGMSSGTRVLILTVIISSVTAIVFPVKEDSEQTDG